MKKIVVLMMIVLMVGCASTHELEKKTFAKTMDSQFVPVSLLIDDGTGGSGNAYPYDSYIHEHIQLSGLFKGLGSASSAPVSIFVKYNRSSNGSTAGDTTKMLVSAATLFLVPTRVDWNYELVFTVTVNGVVKQYRYKDRVQRSMSIVDSGGKQEVKITQNLVNHFLEEIQKDGFIPTIGKPKPRPVVI